MIWELDKKAIYCSRMIQSTILFSMLSKYSSLISKMLISIVFSWSYLLCIFASFNAVYHFYFWNKAAFTMALIQFIMTISLVVHFKNYLMGTKKYLSNAEIIKIKVGNVTFEEKKTVCKKYPSFFEILENSVVDSNGCIILHRDPFYFKTVLQYIKKSVAKDRRKDPSELLERILSFKLPKDVKMLQNIYYEAKFFGIETLAEKCNVKNCLLASEILKIKIEDKEFEINNDDARQYEGFYDLLKHCKIDDNGFFILQRDSTNFETILDYMKTRNFDQEIDIKTKKAIAFEAAYYGITELVNHCDIKKYLLNSELIKVKIGNTRFDLDLAVCKKYRTFYDQLKECKVDDNGYLIVQRDGRHFDKIWKYMRSSTIDLNDGDVKAIREIQYEAKYYGITEVVQECEKSLIKAEANAAVFSRSIFSKEEKDIVVNTGAAVVFLELGFLGKPNKNFDPTAKEAIAQGLIDFLRIRNDHIYSDYALITDFTLPPDEERIGLSIHFNSDLVRKITIFDNKNREKTDNKTPATSLRESIKDACLELAYKMRESSNVAIEGAKRLAITN